ncbi:nucleotidyltransferase family protein [Chrysiogenes arsenatis]|uniref:nucleotidyltransferase family protein n=1 Tax=Chrysiogenes arsenatis TaxID=309797 RepID=UPI0004245940|nr:nucleotidyltransferase domain-containing protein [Chrysiogenes arsenatis]
MTQQQLLQTLRHAQKELQANFGIEKIAIFGSYARNQAQEGSDVDIAILQTQKKDYFSRLKAIHYLEKLLNKKVDMGYLDTMRTIIRQQVEKEMIHVE